MTPENGEHIEDAGAAGSQEAPRLEDSENAPDDTSPTPPMDEQVRELEGRADRLLANWQRSQADFSNYRKQMGREREDLARRANAALLVDILPVLDDLERALANVADSLRELTWVEGIWLIYRKVEAILGLHGVETIPVAPGDPLDPQRHQAVAEVEGEEGKVAAVVQKGYTLHQQLLRPALVAVGRQAEAAPDGDASDEPPQAPDYDAQVPPDGDAVQ